MKNLLKKCSSLSKINTIIFIWITLISKSQNVANYVSNGSFEDYFVSFIYAIPTSWSATDSLKAYGELLVPPKVPSNNYCYQWPKHGSNYLISLQYCPSCGTNKRGYPRNRLKQTLKAGKIYCISLFLNLANQSTHAIDAIGVYFADSSLDTIKQCNIALTYITPQIEWQSGIISDTLNWTSLTATFTAKGNEKYMLIGNFKSDFSTNTTLVNPTNLPANYSSYSIDNISCIEVDAPAYAGPDKYVLAGDSVYIGRERDFAVNPYCIWYQLPNTTSIDTTSGIWVKPTQTTTYVVQQNLECGSLKWDTVVVRVGYTGLAELSGKWLELSVYPNPADDFIELKIEDEKLKIENGLFEIINSLGQVIREEELQFKEGKASIDTKDLESGVYVMTLKSGNDSRVSRRFLVKR